MRKALAVLFIFIWLSLFASEVAGDQVAYVGFEGFSISTVGDGTTIASVSNILTSYVLVWSGIFSFTNEKYVSGFFLGIQIVDDDGTWTGKADVKVEYSADGSTWYSVTYTDVPLGNTKYIPLKASPPVKGTTVSVKVYARKQAVLSSTDTASAYLYRFVLYSINEPNGGILSKLTEFKYIPPGADNTPQGFLLNQSEIYLEQPLSLSEGTITFWLKWDGSTSIAISDNIGIDANGYIYVKNSDGTVYALEGVSPPIGKYVQVYIGWRGGEGYIMLNTTKVTLNWVGNVTITKIGSIANNTATIIDEFKVWNTYIPPDQIIYESLKDQYTLLYNNTAIVIKPEGGQTLGIIDVAFLNENFTIINSTTLSPSQKTAVVPSNATIVVLTRGSVSRTYRLDAVYDTIAFPAEEAQVIVARIAVRPSSWDYLTVKTTDGAVATRIKLENNEGSFTAVYGNQYLFVFERGNETRTRVYTVSTSDIVFYILDSDITFKPPIDVKAYVENSIIVVQYYDANLETSSLDVTVSGYKDYKKVWEVHDFQQKQYGLYTLKVDSNNTEYAQIVIKANVSGQIQEFKRTVYVEGTTTRSPFPAELIPPAVLVLGFALVPMFLFRAIEVHIMLLGGAIGLSIGALLGWIPAMPALITILTVLGIVAMIVYRRD